MKVKRSIVIPSIGGILNKSINKKKLDPKLRTCVSTIKSFHVVPWSSTSDWDRACQLFTSADYDGLIERLLVWTAKVPTLPVGVEGTMCLVQALGFDSKANQFNPAEQLQTRSLYSLALIRFLNHVSHLATQAIGGVGLPMSQLASHVSIPSWLVEMRHEATHGGKLPSLESLRIAASFIKTWLQENYWIDSGGNGSIPLDILSLPNQSTNRAEEESLLLQNITQIISAYVACRVHHLRHATSITDSEVTKLWQGSPRSIPTKEGMVGLKDSLNQFLVKEPWLTSSCLARELIPPPDFYSEFMSLFPGEESMAKLRFIWTPIFKLIQRKRECGRVVGELVKIHIGSPDSHSQLFSALWIRRILGMMKGGRVDYSEELYSDILPLAMTCLNPHSGHFIPRLLSLLKGKVGVGQMKRFRLLSQIWTGGLDGDEVDSHLRRIPDKQLISLDEILLRCTSPPTVQLDSGTVEKRNTLERSHLDPRGSDFWERIPLGHLFTPLS